MYYSANIFRFVFRDSFCFEVKASSLYHHQGHFLLFHSPTPTTATTATQKERKVSVTASLRQTVAKPKCLKKRRHVDQYMHADNIESTES